MHADDARKQALAARPVEARQQSPVAMAQKRNIFDIDVVSYSSRATFVAPIWRNYQ